MEFKEMASVMTDAEVKRCMTILIENSVVYSLKPSSASLLIRDTESKTIVSETFNFLRSLSSSFLP